jgi:hypothetical protein
MACPDFPEYAKIALLLLVESRVVLHMVESEQNLDGFCRYVDLDAPSDEVPVLDYRSL